METAFDVFKPSGNNFEIYRGYNGELSSHSIRSYKLFSRLGTRYMTITWHSLYGFTVAEHRLFQWRQLHWTSMMSHMIIMIPKLE